MPREGDLISYRICRALMRFLLFSIWRWDVEGLENIPADGPVIIVSNHISYWDPVVIAAAVSRQVFFMSKKELFAIPVFGLLIKSWGVFPVDRGHPDRSAIRRALDLLKGGQIVGIFPEGTRNKTGSLLPPSTGAAYFAIRTGAPVCPAAIIEVRGRSSWGLFRRLSLRLGPIMSFTGHNKEQADEVARHMMFKIQELIDWQG